MTANAIIFNTNAAATVKLIQTLTNLKEARDELTYTVASMTQMIDGSDYTVLMNTYDTGTTDMASAGYAELASDVGQLNGDSIKAALNQLFAKFGIV